MMDVCDAEYFSETLKFLCDYQWVYNFQMTKYFINRAWENVPNNWLECLLKATSHELQNLPAGSYNEAWSDSLKIFISLSSRLSVPRKQSSTIEPVDISRQLQRGMSPKKIHEVSFLVSHLHDLCEKQKCHNIVDVGSGLGYLGLVLSEQLGYRVLGLESEETRSHGAEVRAQSAAMKQPANFENIAFHLTDSADSYTAMSRLLEDKSRCNCKSKQEMDTCPIPSGPLSSKELPKSCLTIKENGIVQNSEDIHVKQEYCGNEIVTNECTRKECSDSHRHSGWCMTGLHCCGDLTPSMLHTFLNTPSIHAILCLSCCYHKMTQHHTGEFRQFPLSEKLKDLYKRKQEENEGWKLDLFAMRLAAQETRSRWEKQTKEEHDFHTCSVAYRGILDLAVARHTEAESIQKSRRKIARRKHFTDFDTYIDAVLDRTEPQGSHDRTSLMSEARKLYEEQEKFLAHIEPFTCLQVAMQGFLESLILKDRLCFLREQGVNAELVPLYDDFISPRNMAIIAWK